MSVKFAIRFSINGDPSPIAKEVHLGTEGHDSNYGELAAVLLEIVKDPDVVSTPVVEAYGI